MRIPRHGLGPAFEMVTPGFFQTFGIQMAKGRAFTDQDTASSIRVAIVNETFVNRYLAGVDPLTQRILVEQLIPGVTKLDLHWSGRSSACFETFTTGGFAMTGSLRSTFHSRRVRGRRHPWRCERQVILLR